MPRCVDISADLSEFLEHRTLNVSTRAVTKVFAMSLFLGTLAYEGLRWPKHCTIKFILLVEFYKLRIINRNRYSSIIVGTNLRT